MQEVPLMCIIDISLIKEDLYRFKINSLAKNVKKKIGSGKRTGSAGGEGG